MHCSRTGWLQRDVALVGGTKPWGGQEATPKCQHPAARWKNKQTQGRQTTHKAGVRVFLYLPLKGQAS